MAVYVIAECASTHDGVKANARLLCQAAKEAGADAVKFQYCSDPKAMAKRRKIPDTGNPYGYLDLPNGWIPDLSGYCIKLGIDFMCTVFLEQDIERVEPYVAKFKVASLESQDKAFLERHVPYNKDIIISLGLNGLSRLATPGTRYLYCVAGYPTPPEEAHLSVLYDTSEFDGFSDHTTSLLSGAVAVSRGAQIIEKHLKGGWTLPSNPDYRHSLEFDDFYQYVENIREAETLLGTDELAVRPSEAALLPHVVKP